MERWKELWLQNYRANFVYADDYKMEVINTRVVMDFSNGNFLDVAVFYYQEPKEEIMKMLEANESSESFEILRSIRWK